MAMFQTVGIFVLCIDSNMNHHGEPFKLPMPFESSVSVLAREARSLTPRLLVWKLKQPVNFNTTYLTEVYRILRDAVTFEDNHHVQRLAAYDNIAQHFAGSGSTLQAFIQFPAPDKARSQFGDRVDSSLVKQYESMFITMGNFKGWTHDDVLTNGIQEMDQIPPFVEDYERMLGTKRRVPIDYWDAPGSEVQDTNINLMTEAELFHLTSIASIEPGEEPWPFQIIVQNAQKHYRSYKPKNDFTVLGSSLPRLLVEVNSFPAAQPPQDHYWMLLQAASVVRFANQFLEAYKRNKNCILVAAYVDCHGDTERYILFQDKKRDPRMVCRVFRILYCMLICFS
ncbi:hypothetical protein BJV78DRAFT_1167702 [Lactifluus subvellereus]|nr:hypothetical protein BJV78DRAFT_1167702 [Lactifluus subvellereus]